MATLKAAIALYDGVTAPLKKMHHAMEVVLNSFESMQRASGRAVDTASIHAARAELAQAGLAFDSIEQSIRQADQAQQNLNRSIQGGEKAAGGLLSAVKRIAVAAGGIAAVQKVVNLSDNLTSTNARLSNAGAGFADGGDLNALQESVMASAQRSRAAYLDTAAAVAKIGTNAKDAFDSMGEVVRFTELVNKQFVIGGANAQEQAASMLQLTQALSSGVLRGEELNSVFENAPGIIQAVANYMNEPLGKIRELASDGQITADIVKNAMFAAADEIDARFEAMPLTWGQVFTMASNTALRATQPLLRGINWLANNLDLLAPIIAGVTAALVVYNATQGIAWFTTMRTVAAQTAHTIASAAETVAIFAMIAAQEGLNAALMACPLSWIVIGIIALITIFYAAVAAVNHFAGTSVSATGIICGAFAVAGAVIGNILIGLNNFVVDVFVAIWNVIADTANFIVNAFDDGTAAAGRLFAQMVDTCISVLQPLASTIDAIFGTDFTVRITEKRNSVMEMANSTYGAGKELIPRLKAEDFYQDRIAYTDAWDAGNRFGRGIEEKVKGWFGANDTASVLDYGGGLDGLYDSSKDTAANTAAMAKTLEFTAEELRYMRDIAEREAINRFTTAEIHIQQHNENHISSDMDVDGIMNEWARRFTEDIDISREGAPV